METIERKHSVTTVMKTGDAVGVPEKKWFIAIVNNNTEKKCSERLTKMGYESYVPTQKELHRWCTGKNKVIERIILPSIVFVHINESDRKQIVSLSFINKFMTDRASSLDRFNRHAFACVPENQIETLKFMLYNSDSPVYIEQRTKLSVGDKIRVIRGSLTGLEGFVSTCSKNRSYISVNIDFLGCATVDVPTLDIRKII